MIALFLGGALFLGVALAADYAEDFNLKWSGYYENQAAVMVLPNRPDAASSGQREWTDLDLLDVNKLRLNLRAKPTPGFSARVSAIAQTYHGTTSILLSELLPRKFEQDLAMLAAFAPEYASFTFEDQFLLNDAYLTAQEGAFRLRVGKQPIRFGAGYLWNPTDPFTTIDLLDPSYEKEGVNAVKAQVHLPHEVVFEAYGLPNDDLGDATLGDTGLAVRGRVALGQWVFAATYAGFEDVAGYDQTAMSMDDLMVTARRHMVGGEVTGELGGVGLWAEGAWNTMDPESWDNLDRIGDDEWVEALVGATYIFRGGTTVLAEGLYNGRGTEDPDDYTLTDWFAYLDQTTRYMGTTYAAATLQVPASRINSVFSVMAMSNISDRSMLVSPWVQYNWNQYLAISAYGAFSLADEDTKDVAEMTATGQAAYVRARMSF